MRASNLSTDTAGDSENSRSVALCTTPRRRWFQFSLRTLLTFSVLFSFAAAWYGNHYIRLKKLRADVVQLQSQGWKIEYAYHWDGKRVSRKDEPTTGLLILRKIFGDDFNASILIITATGGIDNTADFRILESIPDLRVIVLSDPQCNLETMQRILKSAKSVKSLVFFLTPTFKNGRALRTFAFDQMTSIREMQNLEQLDLEGRNLFSSNSTNDAEFKCVGNLHNLRSLRLTYMGITDQCLKDFHQLTQLESLDIENNQITGSCFTQFGDLSRLKMLKADSTKLDNAAIQRLVILAPNLENLTLYATKIDDTALDEIVKLQSLKSLKLNGTKVTDAGIEKLAVLKNLTNLQVGSKISLEAKKALQKKLPKCMINDKFY